MSSELVLGKAVGGAWVGLRQTVRGRILKVTNLAVYGHCQSEFGCVKIKLLFILDDSNKHF